MRKVAPRLRARGGAPLGGIEALSYYQLRRYSLRTLFTSSSRVEASRSEWLRSRSTNNFTVCAARVENLQFESSREVEAREPSRATGARNNEDTIGHGDEREEWQAIIRFGALPREAGRRAGRSRIAPPRWRSECPRQCGRAAALLYATQRGAAQRSVAECRAHPPSGRPASSC